MTRNVNDPSVLKGVAEVPLRFKTFSVEYYKIHEDLEKTEIISPPPFIDLKEILKPM